MFSELNCIGDVKVVKVGEFSRKEAADMPLLTEKQEEALKVALINNYYSWPRGSTLEKMAKVAKVSRRSMQERLRRAESKLIPFALKDYLKKRL